MSYQFYKWLHLSSLLIMFLSVGVLLSSAYGTNLKDKTRKNFSKVHGAMLLISFVAGFGMLAKLKIPGVFGFGWIWTKILVWFAVGMLPLVLKRGSEKLKKSLPWALSVLIALTVYVVIHKPF